MADNTEQTNTVAGTEGSELPKDEYLTFRLSGESYGIPILVVQEIIGYEAATPVPNTPDWMCGIINIRGVIIPVIDMRGRFGMEPGTVDDTTVVIINKVRDRVMGVVVDEVQDVMGFTADDMQETPPVSGATSTRFVGGLGKRDGKTVMLLAIEDLLMSCVQEEEQAA